VDHFWFIALAYLATVVVLGGVVAWILFDGQTLMRRLRDLDERGIRRRSHGGTGPASPK
jgi:heme exporter protein CcmD